MLAHSFARIYVVKNYITLYWGFKFSKVNYDNTCAYLDDSNTHNANTKKYLLV